MDCIILPVSILKRRCSGQLGYQPLSKNGYGDSDTDQVTVVAGKEKREFLVEAFVLEESPFRILIEMVTKKEDRREVNENKENKVIFVDVDVMLFEHMLWLMQNDCSSLFKLNLKETIDFYAQDC
ncbi:auxin-responsive protein SAUR77-like [Lycium ferocissimum]|uniref:auxin-responsive protein SAUR77-like n=1 Tax=Lycium ferocissimum TaxID=112874 RepID=UPI002816253A|nr:auxin-responsive protein SAUR77-like [Lycium ferocissimum]